MFQYWGSGEWMFVIWVIGYLITFLIYLFPCGGRKYPGSINLASLVIIFIWPLICIYWLMPVGKKKNR